MVPPVGWVYSVTKQLGRRVTLWRYGMAAKADGFTQPPPPRPRQAGAVRPFSHRTETSRLNSVALPRTGTMRLALRSAI
jgi:hypothetical protein